MLRGFKTCVWFIILVFTANDHFFTKPTKGWWLIMLICLLIAFLMTTDKKER